MATEEIFGETTIEDIDESIFEDTPTETVYPKDDERKSERAPSPVKKRAPVANLLTLAWGGVGTYLISSNRDVPVGRVMQFEAPLAGSRLDALIAGSWLDSLLQPFAQRAEQVEGLGAVILLPLLIGAYERNPSMGTMLETPVRALIHSVLTEMAPVVKQRQADERKAAKSMADISEAFNMPSGTDPVEAILQYLFAPMGGESEAME